MTLFLWTSLVLSALAFGLATGLVPLLALTVDRLQRVRRTPQQVVARTSADKLPSLSVCIPAHDEELNLRRTVVSIKRSIARQLPQGAEIIVANDASHDRTAQIAADLGCNILNVEHGTKWLTLRDLVAASTGEWVALVDAGVSWHPGVVDAFRVSCRDERLIGIAPAYVPGRRSRSGRWVWALERRFKLWENGLGGPVSVHGATTFYRRAELEAAIDELCAIQPLWINDDVVIPLMARCMNPRRKLRYVDGQVPRCRVVDWAERSPAEEAVARQRLMRGNLEWMQLLWPRVWRRSPTVGLVATRRAMRVFGFVWLAWFALSSIALAAHRLWHGGDGRAALTSVLAAAALFTAVFLPQLRHAVKASFAAVMHALGSRPAEVRWK